ncbi:hypothetical protein ACE1SV_77170 [Streptomyces sennicomposti]
MGVDGGGDANVGVAQQLLDHDEFHSLLQEQGRGRVAEVVEPDAAKPGLAEQGVEVPGEGDFADQAGVSGAAVISLWLVVLRREWTSMRGW